MKTIIILIFLISNLLLAGCNSESAESIDNPDKRNDQWCWVVEQETGIGKWVPIADRTNVPDSYFTMFFCNGEISATGKIVNNEPVDTAYHYNIYKEQIFKEIFLPDTTIFVFNDGKIMWHFPTCELKLEGEYLDNTPVGKLSVYYKDGDLKLQTVVVNDTLYFEKKWWENGNLKSERFLNKNLNRYQDSLCIWYYENGNVSDRLYLKNKKLDGYNVWYYEDGSILKEENYEKGLQHGLTTWYFKNGNIQEKGTYKNGKPEGAYVWMYESGKLKKKENLIAGVPWGESIKYYENGNIDIHIYYKNHLYDGLCTWYFENGNVESTAHYKNDQIVGWGYWYHENGQLQQKEFRKNGQPHDLLTSYYENGMIEDKVNYENGEKDGEYWYYYENGNVKENGIYVNGKLLSRKKYDENGNIR